MAATLWIDPASKDSLIGVTVQVFIESISAYKRVRMSPGEALEHLKANMADVTVDWLSDDGQIIHSFASVRWMRDGRQAAICRDHSPVIMESGYMGREPDDDDLTGWYLAIGSSTHPLKPGGTISTGEGSIAYYEGRLSQLLNLGGHDKIKRRPSELCGEARSKRYDATV